MRLNTKVQRGEFFNTSIVLALVFNLDTRLGPNQNILQKKTRGHIIHISDLINEVTGRLVVRNAHGAITQDAQEIINPGAQGDPWWDTAQLLEQMKKAI